MNLIEQLGGYELAKQVFDSVPKDGNSYTVTRDDTGASFHSGEIFKALLEYRRQHNLFEHGDKITVPWDADNLFTVDLVFTEIGLISALDLNGNKVGNASFLQIKHANDAEIKAGKRLPD